MLNVNIGVLGHVDSGKTSLAKALSKVGSTAAFDKNPQSQARGITLDLGFSAFFADVNEDADFKTNGVEQLQFTLVDCPGHASLIRTIIGGAQIIDLMILVIDVTKGIQTQTAECIVLGEILGRKLVIALNKVDMIVAETEEERRVLLEKQKKKLRLVFSKTRWPDAPMIEVAAAPSAEGVEPIGLGALVDSLTIATKRMMLSQLKQMEAGEEIEGSLLRLPNQKNLGTSTRHGADNFLMFVDHCFPIKGQGTVLTGTVIDGAISVGDEVYLPDFKQTKKVKGIQMFKKPVQTALRGDRIGLCVTQFSAENMERGIICGVKAHASAGDDSAATAVSGAVSKKVTSITSAIAKVNKVRFHKLPVEATMKYHFTVGNATVMGTMRFFSLLTCALNSSASTAGNSTTCSALGFDFLRQYDYIDNLPDNSEITYAKGTASASPEDPVDPSTNATTFFAVLQFEQPVTTTVGATIIASKLDTDIHANMCRLAVQGTILTDQVTALHFGYPTHLAAQLTQQSRAAAISQTKAGSTINAPAGTLGTSGAALPPWEVESWRMLNVVKPKTKTLQIDRVVDSRSCIAKGLAPEGATGAAADVSRYVGAKLFWVINLPKPKHADPAAVDATEGTSSPQKRVEGVVDSTFGKSIKVKARFKEPVFDEPAAAKKAKGGAEPKEEVPPAKRMPRGTMVLEYRKFPFATSYRFTQ